eukprot:CAMPEP_0206195432 /NCGR_PEP_ID=MMETSP0166-20121206/7831_1 /ASSEMBLY_ACC=CAM_ASM_000260 /TAXON_ID=95228 /ORGANISM="Vannella robusta, Strain DIVA3 518/3/11/1/6" /LENGTH=413 /DNA_ID=CAMNT_0053612679 /DNA_START=74 /DNA_END=1312 /DNA_ORIENTATION=+
MADPVWGEDDPLAITTIVISFGFAKAIANGVAGLLSDKFGRKIIVALGMAIGIPVPIAILVSPNWMFVTVANLGLGASQGLAASAIVLMLIDILGQSKRGIAVGLLECSIYVSVAIWSFLGVQLSQIFGYQPVPFSVGIVLAAFGALLSLFAKDTLNLVSLEVGRSLPISIELDPIVSEENLEDQELTDSDSPAVVNTATTSDYWLSKKRVWYCYPSKEQESEENLSYAQVICACFGNKQICLCIFSGMMNNVKDGLAWVVFPLYFADDWGVDNWVIGILMLVYPLSWGILQLFTGAASDKISRKIFLVSGMLTQGLSLLFMAVIPYIIQNDSWRIALWFYTLLFLGIGTALIYPVIQAAVSDEVPAAWRGVGIGIYRFCRDMGYVVGALVAGFFLHKSVAILVASFLLLLCS